MGKDPLSDMVYDLMSLIPSTGGPGTGGASQPDDEGTSENGDEDESDSESD